ncbi:hypothetical protein [Pedobacter miscanthi]|uniref:hypothetical protein n=1 Tax=Pedobacter miscanthi TaxID=2259170 RepID=UPI00292F3FE8|nr:hypothetical protein [Pedobacter miscanthi]
MKTNAYLISFFLMVLIGCSSEPKQVIQILTKINHDLKAADYDAYLDSIGYKWVNDTHDGKMYLPKSKKDSDSFIIQDNNEHGIATFYRTNNLKTYLNIIENAKKSGFKKADTSLLDLSSVGIYALQHGNENLIYQKKNVDNNLIYEIRLFTPLK